MTTSVAYASSVDASVHGEYRNPERGRRHFAARITADGRSGFAAEPGRYHLYARTACPASHRLAILRALAGLDDVVSVSYVDRFRDGRGWAFRASTGPDPVNGYTLLREAYEATQAGYDGDVSVPLLWDRHHSRIVSNDPIAIGVDFATAFQPRSVDLYPSRLAVDIERSGASVAGEIARTAARGIYDRAAAHALRAALRRLDARLATRHRLLGNQLTDADIRLWVVLVRLDAGPNAHGAIGPRLDTYRHIWRWARELYDIPAFRTTTRFDTFTAPLADVPPWPGRDCGSVSAATTPPGPRPSAGPEPVGGR